MNRSGRIAVFASCVGGLAALSAPTAAQFDEINPATNFVEQLEGELMSAEGEPAPEPGDQVAAFFQDQLLAVHSFTSDQENPREFALMVFGDDPETDEQEGPVVGDPIRFRFFDSSTNMEREDVVALNPDTGEVFNVTFQGDEAFDLPFLPGGEDLPPFPGQAGREIDLLLGQEPDDSDGGSGGDGGQGGDSGPSLDVNGDGEIDREDAAVVLRLVIGVSRGSGDAADRADVNGDGVVNTQDAIEIIRNR